MTELRRAAGAARGRSSVPEATVARLPLYLRVLTSLADRAVRTVSSETLAKAAGMTSAKVRKDLSYLGSYGTRGVGYDVDFLLGRIAAELGLTEDRTVVLVGVGNLGHALAGYAGFRSRGFRVVALLDVDPDRIGESVGGVAVSPLDEMEALVERNQVTIGVICTPAAAAQAVCDRLVSAGITSILNFAPIALSVPVGVDVRKVDLAVELQILSFHEARKRSAPATGGVAAPTRSPGRRAGGRSGESDDPRLAMVTRAPTGPPTLGTRGTGPLVGTTGGTSGAATGAVTGAKTGGEAS
ncbi:MULTISPECIES: redox-sensing transcriptional repressor Rex [Protofrankia]|uniref:Redox-sensing transcriptional repressor Rex n=1 Tax=Protofrankia coriariae TaxID=1562887 RepID=A0ABR5F0A1_9ACTN|nr:MULTISPECIES: redox-sensing transcriptional repressor Rex [Protofrankia]KLL10100.1 REX family transcriptional regulator [Protofrankia coriariae]ONH36026.1 redox-sensing transcriptional repressor Rex [Protofrankia sp. BMG5.30]